ncbi:hypothetical protein [Roseibium sp. SCP14]|uniref:hypothetical protein n=1 Tax=Roseibium sp. SCP14 TaxID=3141375 RepID=UPI0033380336
MIKERFHNLSLRFALRSLRNLVTGRKSGAVLLSETRQQGNVALVWALDQEAEHLSEEVLSQLKKLNSFETVIVVCPPRHFSALRGMEHFFETLPSKSDIARSGIRRDWDLYLSRRISRIRSTWAPDFEFTVGPSPEDYLKNFSDDAQFQSTGS